LECISPDDYEQAAKVLREIYHGSPAKGELSSFLKADGASFIKLSARSLVFDCEKKPLPALPSSAFQAMLSIRVLGVKEKEGQVTFMYEVHQLMEQSGIKEECVF
jgi:hypothetical protein